MPTTENASIQRYESGSIRKVDDTLVVEANVAIEIGGEELIRTTCSPGQLREWVTGYLFSEGYVANSDDIVDIRETGGRFAVQLADTVPRAMTPLSRVVSDLAVSPEQLIAVAREIVDRADVFHQTGGTHAMAVIHGVNIVSLVEDISRTCALEKALGLALEQRTDFGQSFAFLSSRVPSRMISKLARCGIPIVAAVSAPTIDAVQLADELNICLCGFVRDERLNVYTHGWRVGL